MGVGVRMVRALNTDNYVCVCMCVCVWCDCQQLAASRLRRSGGRHEETNVFENNRRFIRGAEEEVIFSLLLRLILS